jgi:hypothetical protein
VRHEVVHTQFLNLFINPLGSLLWKETDIWLEHGGVVSHPLIAIKIVDDHGKYGELAGFWGPFHFSVPVGKMAPFAHFLACVVSHSSFLIRIQFSSLTFLSISQYWHISLVDGQEVVQLSLVDLVLDLS